MNQFGPKALETILTGLSERQRKVIVGRFGLENKGKSEKMTLEAIGHQFGITRERVRQIEAVSLRAVAENIESNVLAQGVIREAKKELKNTGGVMRRENLVAALGRTYEGINENYLALLLAASAAFEYHPEDDSFRAFYALDQESIKKAEGFIGAWTKQLRAKKQAILSGAYHAEFKDFIKDKKVPPEHAEQYLGISKLIHLNSFGDMGLTDWTEVNPRTIRDRIHLVLRKKHEPVHFTEIAKLINEAKLNRRQALASTVHNELIKDPRFVLVGRGLYGLAEHGYEPGTAQEVIARILQRRGPLKSAEIVTAVQKERLFKPNTILVNLQNKQLFECQADGTYRLREA